MSGIREEGTSYHYLGLGKVPRSDADLAEKLQGLLVQNGLKVKSGKVWTTDAPFRETYRKVRTYQRAGVMAVDMETTAMFSVAMSRHVKLVALLVITDTLHTGRWEPSFDSRAVTDTEKRICSMMAREWTKLL